jgi:hypothetical protein
MLWIPKGDNSKLIKPNEIDTINFNRML